MQRVSPQVQLDLEPQDPQEAAHWGQAVPLRALLLPVHPVRPLEAPHPAAPERAAVQLPVRQGLHLQLGPEDPLEDDAGVRPHPRGRVKHERGPGVLGGRRERDADERRAQ